jgi:hypothetical protein
LAGGDKTLSRQTWLGAFWRVRHRKKYCQEKESSDEMATARKVEMAEMTVHLRSIHGSEAAVGWAGSHTVIVDRPEGKAGGTGLGFN